MHLPNLQPTRIIDNIAVEERRGMQIVKDDKNYIYRLEDKGGSIVRMTNEYCEHNVDKNISKPDMFEEVKMNNTDKLEKKVLPHT